MDLRIPSNCKIETICRVLFSDTQNFSIVSLKNETNLINLSIDLLTFYWLIVCAMQLVFVRKRSNLLLDTSL